MDDEITLIRQLTEVPDLLAAVPLTIGTELQRQAALRERFDPALVRAALRLSDLRQRGRSKFSRADEMWFDRTGLEQSTAEPVALHKAQRFRSASDAVYDLCCGIGMDAIAMARVGAKVIAVDQSAAACLRTELNAQVYGVFERVATRVADVTSIDLPAALVHIDPDRRAGKKRAMKLEDYAPSLDFLLELSNRTPGGGIKLSPASNFGGKFSDCEIELISLHGECKEATVWYGELAGPSAMRATILPSGFSLTGNPWEHRSLVGPRGEYVYDPDPAIVRGGLLDLLVKELNLRRLDAAEEYLTSDELIRSPAIAPFRVLQELPNNNREIRNAVRSGAYGEIEIKSRHVPTDVEAMRKKLPLGGKGRATLIIARLDGRTRALLCERVPT